MYFFLYIFAIELTLNLSEILPFIADNK